MLKLVVTFLILCNVCVADVTIDCDKAGPNHTVRSIFIKQIQENKILEISPWCEYEEDKKEGGKVLVPTSGKYFMYTFYYLYYRKMCNFAGKKYYSASGTTPSVTCSKSCFKDKITLMDLVGNLNKADQDIICTTNKDECKKHSINISTTDDVKINCDKAGDGFTVMSIFIKQIKGSSWE